MRVGAGEVRDASHKLQILPPRENTGGVGGQSPPPTMPWVLLGGGGGGSSVIVWLYQLIIGFGLSFSRCIRRLGWFLFF